MRKYEDMCVGCHSELGCLGNSCPYKNVEFVCCDDCGEVKQLYNFEGEELCIDCIAERLEKV